jgi:hypothetical protein
MEWKIGFTPQATKQLDKLKIPVLRSARFLINDLKTKVPLSGHEWAHYEKLQDSQNAWHCHLNRGRPTYVCCGKVNKIEKWIEVYYVGRHENAPY